jgi:hypothetical protein
LKKLETGVRTEQLDEGFSPRLGPAFKPEFSGAHRGSGTASKICSSL